MNNTKTMFKKRPALAFMGLCLLMIGIEGTFSYCSEKKDICISNYDYSIYDKWFPYTTNQMRIFSSATAKTDSLKISNAFKEKDCNSSGYAFIGSSSLPLAIAYRGAYQDGIGFTFDGLNVTGSTISDTGIVRISGDKQNASSLFHNNIIIGGKTFMNVQFIQIDTSIAKPNTFKVWLATDKGIVAYQKRSNNELFVLQ